MRAGDDYYPSGRRPPLLVACIQNLCTTICSCFYFFCCCWFLRDRQDSYSPLGPHPPGGPTAASSMPTGLHVGPGPPPPPTVGRPAAAFGVPGGPPGLPGPLAGPAGAAAFEPEPLGPPVPPSF